MAAGSTGIDTCSPISLRPGGGDGEDAGVGTRRPGAALVRPLYRHSGSSAATPSFATTTARGGRLLRATPVERFEPRTAAATTSFRPSPARCRGVGPEGDRELSGSLCRVTTHVVTSRAPVLQPRPDYYIVRELGMSDATQPVPPRLHGCYAPSPLADGRSVLRVGPVRRGPRDVPRLCSLHLQLNGSEDNLLANSLFADGRGRDRFRPGAGSGNAAYRLAGFRSALVPPASRT